MKKRNNIFSLILVIGFVASCSSGNGAFDTTTSGGTTSTATTNIIDAANFSVGFSSPTVEVLTFTAAPTGGTSACSNLTAISGSPTTTITVTAADKNNVLVSSGTVYFQVQFGTLDSNQCELSNGQCSVEWSAHVNIDNLVTTDTSACLINSIGTVDYFNSVTAWTYGAEHFDDSDFDGQLSDTETFTNIDEPYLDRDDDGVFTVNTDNLTSADTNGQHDAADPNYNGPDCDTTTRADCGGASLIPIYAKLPIVLFSE